MSSEPSLAARIPIAGPSVSDHEVEAVAAAARDGWYGNAGAYARRFEESFADFVGRRFALALPSCTAGLHLSLASLGIGPGDEVVVPDATWIASAAPVDYVGAKPVFADIDPVTWCISPEALRAVTTARTRAVIVVDLYGGMPNIEGIEEVAQERGLAVIEDAAEAIGSRVGVRPAGSFGVTSVFSFHGSKTLTTGEGGMVLTDDQALYEQMAMLRDHGRPPGDKEFFNVAVGYKYRMSDLQAAFGLAQLERVEELIERKRQIFAWYAERLGRTSGLTLNAEPAGVTNSYWMVTVVLDPDLGLSKEDVGRRLREEGIDTRPFFHPLSSLPAYSDRPESVDARARNSVSYRICPFGLNLPSALCLTEEEVDTVCRALLAIVSTSGGT